MAIRAALSATTSGMAVCMDLSKEAPKGRVAAVIFLRILKQLSLWPLALVVPVLVCGGRQGEVSCDHLRTSSPKGRPAALFAADAPLPNSCLQPHLLQHP